MLQEASQQAPDQHPLFADPNLVFDRRQAQWHRDCRALTLGLHVHEAAAALGSLDQRALQNAMAGRFLPLSAAFLDHNLA